MRLIWRINKIQNNGHNYNGKDKHKNDAESHNKTKLLYNFDISVYPTHWIVDDTGVIRDLIVGTSLNIYDQLSSLIEKNKK